MSLPATFRSRLAVGLAAGLASGLAPGVPVASCAALLRLKTATPRAIAPTAGIARTRARVLIRCSLTVFPFPPAGIDDPASNRFDRLSVETEFHCHTKPREIAEQNSRSAYDCKNGASSERSNATLAP